MLRRPGSLRALKRRLNSGVPISIIDPVVDRWTPGSTKMRWKPPTLDPNKTVIETPSPTAFQELPLGGNAAATSRPTVSTAGAPYPEGSIVHNGSRWVFADDWDVEVRLSTTAAHVRRLDLYGGGNHFIRGGEFKVASNRSGCLQILSQAPFGHTYIEGVKFDQTGSLIGDCLKFGGKPGGGRIVTVQNCASRGTRGTNRSSQPAAGLAVSSASTDGSGNITITLAVPLDATVPANGVVSLNNVMVGGSYSDALNREWKITGGAASGSTTLTGVVNTTWLGAGVPNLSGTGGTMWRQLTTLGTHGDYIQNANDWFVRSLRIHRNSVYAGYQALITFKADNFEGNTSGGEYGTGELLISESDWHHNYEGPKDDNSKLLLLNHIDSGTNNQGAGLLPFPIRFVGVYAEPRRPYNPSTPITLSNVIQPQVGNTLHGNSLGATLDADGSISFGAYSQIQGKIRRGARPGGDWVTWATTGSAGVPGRGYVTPGYHDDPNAVLFD